MKPKYTLQSLLAMAGSTLITVTYVAAADYYWDSNNDTPGFGSTAGTWSAPTLGTATSGWTTNPTGETAIDGNSVTITTADDIFFGITGTTFTGAITIDGPVSAKSIYQESSNPNFLAGANPTITFAADGTYETTSTNRAFPVGTVFDGAGTTFTWKSIRNLNVSNVTRTSATGKTVLSTAAESTSAYPGRTNMNSSAPLGAVGVGLEFNRGTLRMLGGFPYTSLSALHAEHPVSFVPDQDAGLDNSAGGSSIFTVDQAINLGTGAFWSEGNGTTVLSVGGHTWSKVYLTGGTLEIDDLAKLGDPTVPLQWGSGTTELGQGTLKIAGTTITSMGSRPVILTAGKGVSFNIADSLNTFTVDFPLTMGIGTFAKSGDGTLILNHTTTSSTYTGTTTVTAGTLDLSNIPAAVSGLTTVSGTGTLNLSGDNSASIGGVTMNGAGAALNLASASALGTGTLTLQAGTLKNSVTTLSTTHPVNFAGNFTWDDVNDLTFGNGTITNAGSRTITLNGTNSTLTFGGAMQSTLNGNQITTVNGVGNTLVLGGYILQNLNTTPRTNTIQGTGNVTITGAVTNGLATTCGLTKSGAGTLTLEGDNTYDGATTVNTGGTLALVGGSQASAITVANGASLGFTLGSATTSTASVNLTNGTVTISNPGDVDNSSDYKLMTAAGGFTFTDPLTQLGTVITDYELQLQAGDTELWLVYNAGGSPYETWASTNAPSPQTPDDDFDGDGVSNAVEFVLGGDKDTNDLGKLPAAATNGTDMTFTFERDETSADASVAVTIEVSNDLVTWDAGSSPYAVPDTATAGPPVEVVDNGDTHTVTLTIPQAPDTKKFARLKVVITTP